MQGSGECGELSGFRDANADAVFEVFDALVGGVLDLVRVEGVELGFGLRVTLDERDDEVGLAAGD